MDAKEQRRKRDRERYARMSNEEREEKLKKRREAYQQNKTNKDSRKEPDQKTNRRQEYANTQPEHKEVGIEQIAANCELERGTPTKDSTEPEQKQVGIEQIAGNFELERSTPNKDSIAMEKPAYITAEQEVSVNQRKHVMSGEKQKRDRERSAAMTNEKREEKLRKRREAYQKNKKTKDSRKKTDQKAKKRQEYADMQPEKKKARIEKIKANRELKRNTPSKDSIAMENPWNCCCCLISLNITFSTSPETSYSKNDKAA